MVQVLSLNTVISGNLKLAPSIWKKYLKVWEIKLSHNLGIPIYLLVFWCFMREKVKCLGWSNCAYLNIMCCVYVWCLYGREGRELDSIGTRCVMPCEQVGEFVVVVQQVCYLSDWVGAVCGCTCVCARMCRDRGNQVCIWIGWWGKWYVCTCGQGLYEGRHGYDVGKEVCGWLITSVWEKLVKATKYRGWVKW